MKKRDNYSGITIEKLAQITARGFSDIQEKMATKDELKKMATKEDIANLRSEMASKNDLMKLRDDIDLMLDRHIKTFRKDYDELAARVKRIEEVLFK